MRSTFIRELLSQAAVDDRVFLITPDMGFSVLEPFAARYPDRFLNAGIAEQNAAGIAAGLALSGKIVYVYSIIPFITMRCFEQVRVDIAYMNTNVRLIGVGAGLSYGPAGATHHAIEDIAVMRALPNMTVCCPGDPVETRELIRRSFAHDGPMYFRLGKNGEPRIHADERTIPIGEAVTVAEGTDMACFVTSTMLEPACRWVREWQRAGKSVLLASFPTVKPLDVPYIQRVIDSGMPILTVEEHSVIGGLGSAVAEVVAEYGKAVSFRRVGIPDRYSHVVGSQDFLRTRMGVVRPE